MSRGRVPSIAGLSWFGLLVMLSLRSLGLCTSHAQPEPKRPVAAAANCVLNVAKSPNDDLMASARAPDGSPPFLLGSSHSQKSEWFQWPPPLLRTAVRTASGTAARF